MDFQYLKDKQHYIDLYDTLTVEECRRYKKISLNIKVDEEKRKKLKWYANNAIGVVSDIHLYFVTGERYLKRDSTIQQWMEDDRKKDDVLKNANAPSDVRCDTCYFLMQPESRMLDHTSDSMRVMFMFRCQNGCKRGKVVYEDGAIWENPSSRCPHCKTKLIDHTKRTKYKIIMADSCPNCDYVQNDEIDLREVKEKIDPHFEEDRKKYCLSNKDGEQYRASSCNHDNMSRLSREMEEKEKNRPLYDAVQKLKKITVVELEKLISEKIEKYKYIKLVFDKPDIDKFVVIPFTVQDSDPKREKRASEYELRRIINKTLEKTNWRLMTEGMLYRMGYLYGRLKGYEREEDLIKLFSKS